MRARAGDHIIIAGEHVDEPTRAGEVLDCGPDGGPPYTVQWEDGHTSTMYPGPGAVLRVTEAGHRELSELVPRADLGSMREWTVRVTLFEKGDDTTATVALLADRPDALTARGQSHRSDIDAPSAHIGDEVAVARALRRLADGLLARAEHDIEDATGEPDVTVRAR